MLGRKKSYTWPSTHTRCEGGGGIFSASPMWIWTNRKWLNTVSPSRVYKAVQRKAKPCCVLSSFQILCRTSAGIDSPAINLFCSSLHPAWKCLYAHRRGIYFPQDEQVNSPTEWDVNQTWTQLPPFKLSNPIHNSTNSDPRAAPCMRPPFGQQHWSV